MGSQINVLIICGVLATSFIAVHGFGMEKMVGKGTWSLINLKTCENDAQYPYHFEIRRHKVNRTHDGFTGRGDIVNAIDGTYAIRLDICKWLDGGCKPFQKLADKCFCCFAKEHAGENFKRILESAEVDPADCPVPKGQYEIENFVLNYEALSEEGVYGKFDVSAFLIKDKTDVACIKVTVEFIET